MTNRQLYPFNSANDDIVKRASITFAKWVVNQPIDVDDTFNNSDAVWFPIKDKEGFELRTIDQLFELWLNEEAI